MTAREQAERQRQLRREIVIDDAMVARGALAIGRLCGIDWEADSVFESYEVHYAELARAALEAALKGDLS